MRPGADAMAHTLIGAQYTMQCGQLEAARGRRYRGEGVGHSGVAPGRRRQPMLY